MDAIVASPNRDVGVGMSSVSSAPGAGVGGVAVGPDVGSKNRVGVGLAVVDTRQPDCRIENMSIMWATVLDFNPSAPFPKVY
jgi:hypothetical protein